MKRPEQIIQQKVATWCRNNLHPDVIWWATYQNAHSALQGSINKSMGVLAGVSDMIFSYQRNMYFLELKSKGGNLASVQANFLDAMARRGHYTAVCYGYDATIAKLIEWELPQVQHEEIDWQARGF